MASPQLIEEVEMTLEGMLNLAMGSPEIGAVNFNFLYEVIYEILKHLGITKKIARVTKDIDYRDLDDQWASSITADTTKQVYPVATASTPDLIFKPVSAGSNRLSPDSSQPQRQQSPDPSRKQMPQQQAREAPLQRSRQSSEVPPQHNRQSSEASQQHNRQSSEASQQHSRQSSEVPPQHNWQSSEVPPQHNRQSSEASPQNNRHSSEATPQHNRQSSETPPKHNRQSSEASPQHNRQSSETPPQQSRQSSEAPPQHNRQSSEGPPQHNRQLSEASQQQYRQSLEAQQQLTSQSSETPEKQQQSLQAAEESQQRNQLSFEAPQQLQQQQQQQQQQQRQLYDQQQQQQQLQHAASTHILRDSMHYPSRRISQIQARRSSAVIPINQWSPLKPAEIPYQDIALINRSLERKDSKTPASDMWHVLNINRRLEAAEATIQGMTNLIDTTSASMEEFKTAIAQQLGVSPNNPDHSNDASISKPEQEVVKKLAAKIKGLDGKFTEWEKKLEGIVMKEDLEDLCDRNKVLQLIQHELINYNPLDPAGTDGLPQLIDAKTLSMEEIKKVESSEKATALRQAGPHASRTKIVFTDLTSRINVMETELAKANERIKTQEKNMRLKLEVKDIETKVDQSELEESMALKEKLFMALKEQLADVESDLNSLKEAFRSLSTQNDECVNQQKSVASNIRKLERALEDTADSIFRCQNEISKNLNGQRSNTDDGLVTQLRANIFDLQEQQTRLQTQLEALSQDAKAKSFKLVELMGEVHRLNDEKVGKEFVMKQVEDKVSIGVVEDLVSREQFDTCIGGLDQNVLEILQKLDHQEMNVDNTVASLQRHMADKLDRDEASTIRQYIDTRFKTFKPKLPEHVEASEGAAGSRKRLIPNFNCISCDRHVEVDPEAKGPAMTYCGPLPGAKTNRPYATFDLQEIRSRIQQSWFHGNKDRYQATLEREKLQRELLRLCGVRDLDDLASRTDRACGGVHTLVESNRRTINRQALYYREEMSEMNLTEKQLFETDVLGRDGHIYKGRMEVSGTLPEVTKKSDVKQSANPSDHVNNRAESPILPRPSKQKSAIGSRSGMSSGLPKLNSVESNS